MLHMYVLRKYREQLDIIQISSQIAYLFGFPTFAYNKTTDINLQFSYNLSRSASEEKYSKSLPDKETFGSRARPTQLLTKLTPKPRIRQLSQTSSLLSSTSITDTSDEDSDEEIHAYNEKRPRRHH